MTHINPGTDTTINPVVIDDSKRERKQSRCIHSRVCRFRFVSDPDCDGLISGDSTKENRCSSFASRTSATAQERVDAANKERDDLIQWLSDYANHRIYWSGNGCAYDIKTKLKEIALLQAAEKSGRMK